MEVNKNNIEEQILLYVDGELDTAAAKSVLLYIALHPEWQSLLEEYKSLVIQPDTAIVFEGKEQLLRPEEGQVIAFKKANSFKKIGWAAAAVLLIGAAGLTWMLSRPDSALELPDGGPVAVLPKQIPAPATTDTATTVQVLPTVARNNTPVSHKSVTTQPANIPAPAPATKRSGEVLNPMAGNTLAAIPVEAKPLPAKELQRPVIEQEIQEAVAVKADVLPAWLPINEEKLEGVNDLVAQIKIVKEKVTAKADLIRKSTFVIRLGGKEIAFGK